MCRNPSVQSRYLFINSRVGWIKDMVSRNTTKQDRRYADGGQQSPQDGRNVDGGQLPTNVSEVTESYSLPLNPRSAQTKENVFQSSNPHTYPYLVYLTGRSGEPECGGTLVTSVHVLSSAYCTARLSAIKVNGQGLFYDVERFDGCFYSVRPVRVLPTLSLSGPRCTRILPPRRYSILMLTQMVHSWTVMKPPLRFRQESPLQEYCIQAATVKSTIISNTGNS
jgi:hypothetical protein